MSDLILLLLICVLLLCLLGTLGGLLVYSGLLADVEVKTGPPPVANVTVAYKFKQGSYKDCGAGFTESCSIGPKLKSIGIFYDDPKQRPPEKCRYAVGSVLSEGDDKPDEELVKLYEKFGFTVFSLPEVDHAVTTSFPCTSPLSHILGPYRVYSTLSSYIEERKLCAFPTVEIYTSDVIHYMVPQSRQTDFYVPEVKEEFKTDAREEDSDEDRGTDITGADSHSDVSSVSGGSGGSGGGAPWDSRETSLAASTAASLASSLPLRDVVDANKYTRNRDPGNRDSDESMGSGSSFEELDMEQDEGVERENTEEEEEGIPEGEGGNKEEEELVAGKKEPLGEGEE